VTNYENFLLLLIAIAVCLRVSQLGSREFWYDEVLSLLLVTGQKNLYHNPGDTPFLLSHYQQLLQLPVENSFRDILQTLKTLLQGLVVEPHPLLFFLEQHFWLRCFGNSEAAMRSLVMLFSIVAIACSYGLGKTLLGHRGGLLFAALLALNPYYFFQSLNLRMYSSLVFWTVLSSWALVKLLPSESQIKPLNKPVYTFFQQDIGQVNPESSIQIDANRWIWWGIFTFAITGGFLTLYYFLYWLVGVIVIILCLDRRRWWQYTLSFSISIIFSLPWLLWGTRQQLHNADLERFSASGNFFSIIVKHFSDLAQVFGTQLISGDWVTNLTNLQIFFTGLGAIALLIFSILYLYQNQNNCLLIISLGLGLVPLLFMVSSDLILGKFTLGFGWGRAIIFSLPGLLLLLTIFFNKLKTPWQNQVIIGFLSIYLIINLSDVTLRSRQMFHQIAAIINQQSQISTLIVINSQAWGHLLRFAYYLPPQAPLFLLAQSSEQLASTLQKTLTNPNTNQYDQILWIESNYPVWNKPLSSDQRMKIQTILEPHFQKIQQEKLSGTQKLDSFFLQVYTSRS
jgi:uncharacterized membrane protein